MSLVTWLVPKKVSSPAEWVKTQGGAQLVLKTQDGAHLVEGEDVRPRLSYASMIARALRDCGGYATLSQIYKVNSKKSSVSFQL